MITSIARRTVRFWRMIFWSRNRNFKIWQIHPPVSDHDRSYRVTMRVVSKRSFQFLTSACVAKNAPYACGNFHASTFTRFRLQEWPLAGRATVPRVLYGIGLRMSLRRQTILSKSLWAPTRVALTIHTFRMVDKTEPQVEVVVLFGKRWEFGDNREVWKAFVCRYAPPRSCCSWGTAEAKRCMPTPRRLHWMASDVIDAKFALRRCQCVDLLLTERIFFLHLHQFLC